MRAAYKLGQWANNLSIAARLTILVCCALLAIVVTALSGMLNNKRMSGDVALGYQAITRPLAAVANARGEFNAMRTGLYDLAQDFNSSEQYSEFKRQILKNLADFERNIILYRDILETYGTSDPYEQKAVDYLYRQLAPLRENVEAIAAVAEQTGRSADAVRMLRGDFLDAAEDVSSVLLTLTKVLETQTQNANMYADSLTQKNQAASLTILGASALCLLLIASLIVRSITGPMKEMTIVAESLANGVLNVHIGYSSRNEIGRLAASFTHLARSVINIIQDMGRMAENQSHGDIEYFIDTAPYKGSFNSMVAGINTMMRISIDDLRAIINCLNSLAEGKFNAHLEPFPGKKAIISDSVDAIYKNLLSVHTEINAMVKTAANGRLDARVDAGRYAGDWAALMVELNLLLAAITVPINEAAAVLQELGKGNFDARMRGDYRGDFAQMKEVVNATAIGLSSYLRDKLAAERAAHESELAKGRAEAAKEAILASIYYASKIQRNLRPMDEAFQQAFSDYSIIWEPRDIVGGDIYWMKKFNRGTILCVCDCTGHGTPGALLTMLVVSALEATVNEENYMDTADVMAKLDQRLASILNVGGGMENDCPSCILDFNDGCDLAILFVADDSSVTVSSANVPVFICDGRDVAQIKGQKLHIGEGKLHSSAGVKVVTIPANPANKFYIASDGLYDQIGGKNAIPFGYKMFKKIILDHHAENLNVATGNIWEAFQRYRGEQPRRDDVELITFKPRMR